MLLTSVTGNFKTNILVEYFHFLTWDVTFTSAVTHLAPPRRYVQLQGCCGREQRYLTIKLLNKQDKTIVFQWIPSHVGIHGNETADLLAKKGTTLLSKRTTLNFETIKRFIKQKNQEKFFQEATRGI